MCTLGNINIMVYFYAAGTVRVTIFSTGRNSAQFWILQLHAPSLVTRSYGLLLQAIVDLPFAWPPPFLTRQFALKHNRRVVKTEKTLITLMMSSGHEVNVEVYTWPMTSKSCDHLSRLTAIRAEFLDSNLHSHLKHSTSLDSGSTFSQVLHVEWCHQYL